MKKCFFLIALFFAIKASACDCNKPIQILEFYNSEYVFEGTVVAKEYAEDFQTYTVTFKISKHYKKGVKPKLLKFKMQAEEIYTGKWTTCDWSVDAGEKWLVYAKNKDSNLSFGYYCTNSKRLDYNAIHDQEQKVLDNGNEFKLDKYIYESQEGFTNPKPITNIDSIIKTTKIKTYKKPYITVKMYINRNGSLQYVSRLMDYFYKRDSIFNLPHKFLKYEVKPSSEFEKDALELAEKIKNWEQKLHIKTKAPVAYVRSIIFKYDSVHEKWTYEL